MYSAWKVTPTFYSGKAYGQAQLILGLSCFVCSLAKVIIVLSPLPKVTLQPLYNMPLSSLLPVHCRRASSLRLLNYHWKQTSQLWDQQLEII